MAINPKDECSKLRNNIKFIASNKAMSLKELVLKTHQIYARSSNASSFSTRLKRGSLSIIELLEVLEILDKELIITDKS